MFLLFFGYGLSNRISKIVQALVLSSTSLSQGNLRYPTIMLLVL